MAALVLLFVFSITKIDGSRASLTYTHG